MKALWFKPAFSMTHLFKITLVIEWINDLVNLKHKCAVLSTVCNKWKVDEKMNIYKKCFFC